MVRICYVLLTAILCFVVLVPARAQSGGFAVQVSPSPIVEKIDPGVSKTVEVKIRNQNTEKETFKMGLRAFDVNKTNGEIELSNDEPKEVVDWVSFSEPVFDVEPGQWFTQKVVLNAPIDAGFTYTFAITISRATPTQEADGKTTIEGSVAIFTLLTTNRPDATRKLDIVSFVSKKRMYEYLPASFELELKNSGNTIIQPVGNIYIQRSSDSSEPIEVLSVNETGAYILPEVSRTLQTEWSTGFPVFKDSAEEGRKDLFWNWSELQNLRIGHYVAKVVVVYNDGTRDIPVETMIDFWVIPWKILSVLFVIFALLVTGVVSIIRKTIKVAQHKRQKHDSLQM